VSAAATGELVVLAATVALAVVIYYALRSRVAIAPNLWTRVFGGVMTAHAVVNLVGRNLHAGAADPTSLIVANIGALIFLGVYGNLLWRHRRGPILAALSLLFASYAIFIALTVAHWVPVEPALLIYASVFAGFGLLVAGRSMRLSRRWEPAWGGRARASRP
jgi:hypothetical protein